MKIFDPPISERSGEWQGTWLGIITGAIGVVVVVLWIAPAVDNFMAKRDALRKAHIPMKAYSYGGHEWITFDKGGLYHNPDCPCKATE